MCATIIDDQPPRLPAGATEEVPGGMLLGPRQKAVRPAPLGDLHCPRITKALDVHRDVSAVVEPRADA